MIYDSFAPLYDELFDPDQYRQWLHYVQANLDSSDCRVLDLAGGSGRLSVLLAQAGFQVCDLDFSSSMLSLADAHAKAAGVPLELVQADMRDLSGLGYYDAVVCFADSLCYLGNFADVQTTMAQVYRHLAPGGRFLFDVWSLHQVDAVFPGYCYNEETEDGQQAFMWRSYADDDVDHGIIHELTFFTKDHDGRYKRSHETHFERTYPLNQWERAVKEVGFDHLTVSANFGRDKIDSQTGRLFFSCRKGSKQ